MENGFIDVLTCDKQSDDEPLGPHLTQQVPIDRILDERGGDKGEENEFLIKWKPVKQCWISAKKLNKFPELIEAFKVLRLHIYKQKS